MNKSMLSIVFLLILSSCHEVLIENPMPSDTKPMTKIPRVIRGDWLMESWMVEPNGPRYFYSLRKRKTTTYKEMILSKSDLDSLSYQIQGDKIIDLGKDSLRGFDFVEKSDSVYFFVSQEDKLVVDADHLLQRSGKYFFSNNKNENNWWEVSLIDCNDDEFSIRVMSKESSEQLLKYGLEMMNDTSNNDRIFQSSKIYLKGAISSANLNKFVESGGFPDTIAVFSRIHNLKEILQFEE